MALSVYCGPPGAGKTYAIVAEVILPAIRAGRRVLTNVDGLDADRVALWAAEQGIASPGHVERFHGDDTLQGGFWPALEGDASAKVQPGDLLVMDEVKLYWPSRAKFPVEITKFFRFHRHFVAIDGRATDIVLATQVLTDVHADIRGITERSFRFKKLAALGLNKSYVWTMWEGPAQRKGEEVTTGTGSFKPEVFNLYSSFKGGADGQVVATDKRSNVLLRPKVIAMALGCVAMFAFSGFFLWKMFHKGEIKPGELSTAEAEAPQKAQAKAVGNSPGGGVVAAAAGESPYRVAGVLEIDDGRFVVLASSAGEIRLESPSVCRWVGGSVISCSVDGKTAWPANLSEEAAPSSGLLSSPIS